MNAIKHVRAVRGPLATVHHCPFCNDADGRVIIHHDRMRRGRGRGWGLATASQARAIVAAHIKAKHAEALT